MKMTNKLESMRESMLNELMALAAKSETTRFMCKYDRYKTRYIEVNVSIKHEGHHCKSNYCYLSEKGELAAYVRGGCLVLKNVKIMTLAEIYDQIVNNCCNS